MKTAILRSTSPGLNETCAKALHKMGYTIVALDPTPQPLHTASYCVHDTFDLSTPVGAESAVLFADKIGPITLLFNNAATHKNSPVNATWEDSCTEWESVFDTTLLSTLLLSRASVPALQASGGGSIINLSSTDVLPVNPHPRSNADNYPTNPPDQDILNAATWALNGFTDAWAQRLRDDHINVNGLCITRAQQSDSGYQQLTANVLLQLLQSNRTGENIGIWPGDTDALPPIPAPHQKITGNTQPTTTK